MDWLELAVLGVALLTITYGAWLLWQGRKHLRELRATQQLLANYEEHQETLFDWKL